MESHMIFTGMQSESPGPEGNGIITVYHAAGYGVFPSPEDMPLASGPSITSVFCHRQRRRQKFLSLSRSKSETTEKGDTWEDDRKKQGTWKDGGMQRSSLQCLQ